MKATDLHIGKHVCRAIRSIDLTLWHTGENVRPGRHLLDARKALIAALHEYGFVMTADYRPKRRVP